MSGKLNWYYTKIKKNYFKLTEQGLNEHTYQRM